MEEARCACRGHFLEKFVQPSILLELYRHSQPAPALQKLIEGRSMLRDSIDTTGFYRTLKKMEEAGRITSKWEIAKGRRPVRVYALTAAGEECLRTWRRTLSAYRGSIDELLNDMDALALG